MLKYIKKNYYNIFLVTLAFFLLLTGKFNVIFSKINAYMGEDQGKKAYNFQLKDIKSDKIINLSDLKGKVVLVEFWATWCPPCKFETPSIVSLYNSYKQKGFEVVAISMDQQGKNVVIPYMNQEKIEYTVALGNKNVVEKYGNIISIPTAFLIDRKGIIAKKYVGITLKSTFESDIKSLL